MLELQVQESLLEKVIESIKDFVYVNDAVNFDCSASGISLQFIDQGRIAFVELLLHAKDFEHYRCDTNISMGINIANMEKIIKCAGSDDNVTLLAADGSDTITFMIKNPDQGKIADFEMKLMDINNEHITVPKGENLATVRMPSAQLAKIFRDLSSFGDYVVISMSKEGAKFSTSGDTGVGGNIVLTENTVADKPEDDTIIEIMEPVSSTFSLRYLNSFTKATPLSNTVTISLSSELPVVVEYKIAEMGYIRFYLAAKI